MLGPSPEGNRPLLKRAVFLVKLKVWGRGPFPHHPSIGLLRENCVQKALICLSKVPFPTPLSNWTVTIFPLLKLSFHFSIFPCRDFVAPIILLLSLCILIRATEPKQQPKHESAQKVGVSANSRKSTEKCIKPHFLSKKTKKCGFAHFLRLFLELAETPLFAHFKCLCCLGSVARIKVHTVVCVSDFGHCHRFVFAMIPCCWPSPQLLSPAAALDFHSLSTLFPSQCLPSFFLPYYRTISFLPFPLQLAFAPSFLASVRPSFLGACAMTT